MFKQTVTEYLERRTWGRKLLWHARWVTGRLPRPDLAFPQVVTLELSSVCNLSCIHCPPQHEERQRTHRRGFMDPALVERLMDEVDRAGKRRVALHKDGEPLLHPYIEKILPRIKNRVAHEVYLSTNGHRLDERLSRALLDARIDIVNFSLGAATAPFYERVRGEHFDRVMHNIELFLSLRDRHPHKPRTMVQIIRLPGVPGMGKEIRAFRNLWRRRDVEIQVWDKLSWGLYGDALSGGRRYPCYSLWESVTINADGKVSACCVDWRQELLTGDVTTMSIREVWQGPKLRRLRQAHVEGRYDTLPLCPRCNYWEWCPRIAHYPLGEA